MKRLIYVFIIAGFLLHGTTSAQSYTVGIKGGISIPNLSAGGSDTPLSEGYKSRIGSDFGIFIDKHFTQIFSISLGIEYSEQGGKKNGFQALPSNNITTHLPASLLGLAQTFPTYIYSSYNNTAKLNYLLIPVLAKFGWKLGGNSPFKFNLAVGPFAGFLVKARQETSASGSLYFDEKGTIKAYDILFSTLTQQGVPSNQADAILSQLPLNGLPSASTNIKPDTHTFNTGIMGTIGFSYILGHNTLFIEGGGNYGFLKIQKDASNGENRIGAGVVMLGYGYTF